MNRLLIIGGGGHAKAVIDAALADGSWDIVGLLDDSPDLADRAVLDVPVLGTLSAIRTYVRPGTQAVVAVGGNRVRAELQDFVSAAGLSIATIVHPAAVVAASASLGSGTVVMAGAVINAEARLGRGVIVNTGATVDHDCQVGDFAHLAPGVSLCGGVKVGRASLVGVGAAVIPGVVIGSDCTVAAGATVTLPVKDGMRVAGTPAREM